MPLTRLKARLETKQGVETEAEAETEMETEEKKDEGEGGTKDEGRDAALFLQPGSIDRCLSAACRQVPYSPLRSVGDSVDDSCCFTSCRAASECSEPDLEPLYDLEGALLMLDRTKLTPRTRSTLERRGAPRGATLGDPRRYSPVLEESCSESSRPCK